MVLCDDAFELIESTIAMEFVPAVYFSELPLFEEDRLSGVTLISFASMFSVLPDLVNQSIKFVRKYRSLSKTNETIKYMHSMSEENIRTFLNVPKNQEAIILKEFAIKIYEDRSLIDDVPEGLWVIEKTKQGYEAIVFGDQLQTISEKGLIPIDDEMMLLIEKSRDTGLFDNFDSDELSDINHIASFIANEYDLRNVAVYTENNITLVGCNFIPVIRAYDLDILKSLCSQIMVMKVFKKNILEIEESFVYTMDALARAAESKDEITGDHIKRVNSYSALIASELGLDNEFIKNISIAAQMHDVGKISISEKILNKPGKLTDKEFLEMQNHTVYGKMIIGRSKNLSMAAEIANYHHEKYDGSGYPEGLVGEKIPLSARIVALGDVYDALRSSRSYKEGYSHKRAYDIIVNGDGRVEPYHFDPEVLKVFIRKNKEFEKIFDESQDY